MDMNQHLRLQMPLSNLFGMDVENPQTCILRLRQSLVESFSWQNVKCLCAYCWFVLSATNSIYCAALENAAALNLTRCIIYVCYPKMCMPCPFLLPQTGYGYFLCSFFSLSQTSWCVVSST